MFFLCEIERIRNGIIFLKNFFLSMCSRLIIIMIIHEADIPKKEEKGFI